MSRKGKQRGGWNRCRLPADPCPICGKGNPCSVSADGELALCHKEQAGSYKAVECDGIGTCYLHRLKDGPRKPQGERQERAKPASTGPALRRPGDAPRGLRGPS